MYKEGTSMNFSISWIKAALIRALKTVCQTAIAMIGTAAVMASVDWKMVASAALLAGIISILTSLAGLPETTYDTENLGGESVSNNDDTFHEVSDPEDEEGDN